MVCHGHWLVRTDSGCKHPHCSLYGYVLAEYKSGKWDQDTWTRWSNIIVKIWAKFANPVGIAESREKATGIG